MKFQYHNNAIAVGSWVWGEHNEIGTLSNNSDSYKDNRF